MFALLIRVRIAIVDWLVRASEQSVPPAFQDVEGLGRLLARPRSVPAQREGRSSPDLPPRRVHAARPPLVPATSR